MLETHCEKNLVINGRELKYSGIFRSDELFAAINQALRERGYERREKKTEETVTVEGKRTLIELRPYKEKTSYVALMLKIRIILEKVTETVQPRPGQQYKEKFQQGDILLIFDAWSMTDYEARWGLKPWAYFLKGLINKFLYTWPLEAGFMGEVMSDTAYIYARAKKLLLSYQPERAKPPAEEEIRRKVEEEMEEEMKQGLKEAE
ncbi:MAG: hypothetical protein AABX13_05925 [Nanoarchaeota archaeon]